jgi:hypothetical protein
MGKPLKDPDDEFMRKIHFAEEDRRHFTRLPYTGGYRWFRSPNIVPIEQARATRKTEPSDPDAA